MTAIPAVAGRVPDKGHDSETMAGDAGNVARGIHPVSRDALRRGRSKEAGLPSSSY
jgi:hypothetical protein